MKHTPNNLQLNLFEQTPVKEKTPAQRSRTNKKTVTIIPIRVKKLSEEPNSKKPNWLILYLILSLAYKVLDLPVVKMVAAYYLQPKQVITNQHEATAR